MILIIIFATQGIVFASFSIIINAIRFFRKMLY